MKRTLFAVLLGAIAVGVLVLVALESRQISATVHIAENRVRAETDLVIEDFDALVGTLQSAWTDKQLPGDAAHALANRISTTPSRLQESVDAIPGSSNQRGRIRNSFVSFQSAVDSARLLTAELLVDQTAYGESAAVLRDLGPSAVQRMRDLGLERGAGDIYELVVGSLDFATDGAANREYELRRLLATVARDQRIDANMPRELDRLSTAVETILASRGRIESGLDQLTVTPVVSNAANLARAVQETYQNRLSRAERARWILAVYALVLLGTVALVAYRLKDSYRALNVANAELETLNESLEERVRTRTMELEDALSDLKESQVQLVQAEKMSSLGQLVAGISHEINTPLLYLANNVELIGERLEMLRRFLRRSVAAYSMRPGDFPSRAEYQQAFAAALTELKKALNAEDLDGELGDALELLSDCDSGLKDLSEIAQSLKDFSRLDRAPVGNFNINSGLDKTLLIAKNIIKHKATVTKHYGDVPEIVCSPSQINQVFLNLITNAAQSIETMGEIILSTQDCGDHVAVVIEDTGSGIPAEIIDRIREPFFTTKQVGSGTGLGLSIVDEIVRSHGGELSIESAVGKGSRFTLTLPVRQAEQAAPDDAAEEASSRTGNLAAAG